MAKIVVLLSGGMDSATVLALALANGHECIAVTFDYGQANRSELHAAENIARESGVQHVLVRVQPDFWRGASPLTGGDTSTAHIHGYVPGRNTLFLSMGLAIAESSGASEVHFGANAEDADEYPDCRLGFVRAMSLVAALGLRHPVEIRAPLLTKTKREVVELGKSLGAMLEWTTSCALDPNGHCGKCRGCLSREEAWRDAL